jgi:hypothetical protein
LGFVSLLAVAALVVVPAVTQGAKAKSAATKPPKPPLWTCGTIKPTESKKCQVITWGTLTFKFLEPPGLGSVTCKKSNAENVWNPSVGPGRDEVVLLDFYECHGTCKLPEVKASGLPWPTELERVGVEVRNKIKNIKLEVCGIPLEGELTPKMVNSSPTYEEFTSASGFLHGPGAVVEVTGRDKVMGFENQEKVTAK